MADALLTAERLWKSFKTPRRDIGVLQDCSLELFAGQALSILGSSGSGKSTLLHILGTLEPPDSGRILYRGEDMAKAGSRRLSAFRREELGFIFQFHHLMPEFSAEENVALPALIDRWPRQKAFARAGELLDVVGLGDRREHRPGELSGGEQQRVAVARALIGGPRLVLADEPTGNLDGDTGSEVAQQLFDLCREAGMGLVLVTHDRDLAERADRVVHLENGSLKPV